MNAVKKIPFLGFIAGGAMLALAWGIKSLNPIVRLVLVLSGAVLALMHSATIITQVKGAWKQL